MHEEIVIESRDQLNEILNTDKALILYFDTNSWGVGKALFPKLIGLALDYNVKVLYINIDNQPAIKGQFLVFSAPTVLIIKDKREELRESKFIDFEKINRVLESLCEM